MTHIPVLIVGGGPSGLIMACELARHGIAFRIIDKKSEQTQTSNAAGIQTRTLEVFEQMGIVERFLLKGLQCKSIDILADKAEVKVEFNHLDSHYQFILMLPQVDTERLLNHRLEEYQHHVERPLEFVQLKYSDNIYHIELKDQHNNIESLTCDWLIACDGARSTIREQYGLHFIGEDINEQFMVADATMHSLLQNNQLRVFTKDGKTLATFPLGHGKYRLAANLNQAAPRQFFTEREVKEIIMERGNGEFNVESVSWISPFWIHSKMLETFRVDNTFFIGDAAHIHSPVGGQGMNTGIQDAHNLAWKLALVIKQQANEKLLDSYQAERLPIVKRIVHTTEVMTKMLINSNKAFGIVRNFILKLIHNNKFILHKISMQISQLSIHYKKSPIINYQHSLSPSPRPGYRAPDVVINRSTRLYNYLKHTRHTLLLFTGTNPSTETLTSLHALQNWITEKYADIAISYLVLNNPEHADDTIEDLNYAIHQRYKVKQAALYIIRPDNYIGGATKHPTAQTIEKYFNDLFIRQ
jgi:2-polyprenyl-6-methoxyphenol hydroxylase-like FAD-dependent oxidoreductase